ncbi:MAG: hypothetical protein KDC07_08190 [Chitinophagaceae bacterium]|nr:hypothetical protein [Chitinophagaceae bacterium]MCB9047045.1 hypothetical protein [Chitinophagales bacterium]
MHYVLLVRGYAAHDVLLWVIVLALLVIALGGRWLIQRISHYIRHRRTLHLWPFK